MMGKSIKLLPGHVNIIAFIRITSSCVAKQPLAPHRSLAIFSTLLKQDTKWLTLQFATTTPPLHALH